MQDKLPHVSRPCRASEPKPTLVRTTCRSLTQR